MGSDWGGPVLAHQIGAELADLEFCQFHPTALSAPGSESDGSLITEAVRGEGATLLDASGERFTDELAPRDQVAAAIGDRMRADGTPHVHIDLREIEPSRFPNVFATLERAGFDPRPSLCPWRRRPTISWAASSPTPTADRRVPGLYAVGECACTGLHGANRLASNSLSECFVFGERAARHAVRRRIGRRRRTRTGRLALHPPTVETRAAVWQLAGPSRNAERLAQLEADPYPLAALVARAALARAESRGSHRRTDFPLPDSGLDGVHLVLQGDGSPRQERWV